MPEFDSLSFALLIPFAICFVLVFIVCCFADEIKDICRMPSPLPRSYLAPEHVHQSRHNSRRPQRHARRQIEEARNLILSEEGRSRNVSESSTDYISASNLLANSTNSNLNYLRQAGASLQHNVMVLQQSQVPDAGQRSGIPNSSATVSSSSRHTFQPLSVLANENFNSNYNRNLTIHVSSASKDLRSCLKPKSQTDLQVNKEQSLNRTDSAPYLLNSYLYNETSDVSHPVTKQNKKDTESGEQSSGSR